MSFRIAKDEIVTSLNAIRRLKIPIYTALPTNLAGTGGYFAGLSVSGGGVDLYYFDGDIWFKVVDSSAPSGGLPNTLAINNNSGGVNNIILDNNVGTSPGALSSITGDDLNILAGANNTSTAGTAENIVISSGSTAMVNISAGTNGVTVGANAVAKTVTIGNNTGTSQVINHFGTGGNVMSQPAPAAPAAGAATLLTIVNLLTGILVQDPGGASTWTLPDADLAVAGVPNVAVNDSIDFSIINLDTMDTDTITLAAGASGTMVGQVEIAENNGISSRSEGLFRMRFTNIGSGTEAYTVYRLA